MAEASRLILVTFCDWDGDQHEVTISTDETVALRDTLDRALKETDE